MISEKTIILLQKLYISYNKYNNDLFATEENKLYLPYLKVIINNHKDYDKFLKILDLKIKDKNRKFSEEEKLFYQKRMQVYAHEYFHFFQVLSLPTVQYQALILRRKVELEAVVLLKCIENKIIPIFNAIEDGVIDNQGLLLLINKIDDTELSKKIESFANKANYFHKVWFDDFKKISLWSIIESMAHIYSLQVNNSSDKMGLDNEQLYNRPFKYFLESFKSKKIDKQWQYMFFLYICYFSTKNYSNYQDDVEFRVNKTFFHLCSNMELYLKFLINRKKYYQNFSREELKSILLDKLIFPQQLFKFGTREQQTSLTAFFDTIHLLEENSKKFKSNKKATNSLKELENYIKMAKKFHLDIDNIYTLANISIFPENFAFLMDIHNNMMSDKKENTEFDLNQESEFYSTIIERCSLLLQKNTDIKCCEEHGIISNKRKILQCKNSDSFAILIKNFLDIELKELFWVR